MSITHCECPSVQHIGSKQTPSVQHIGFTQGPHLFSTQNPSALHQKLFSSTPNTPRFNIKNPSVPSPLSSTPKTPQFNIPLSLTHSSVPHQNWKRVFGTEGFLCETEGFLVWNWWGFSVELRDFWCGTEGGGGPEGFLVWNWGILGAEKLWSLCGTDELNWGGLCRTEGHSSQTETMIWSIQGLCITGQYYRTPGAIRLVVHFLSQYRYDSIWAIGDQNFSALSNFTDFWAADG